MSELYEVLKPWAEVDPRPVTGISDRVEDLKGKNIGLFANFKRAAPLILTSIKQNLKEKFPEAEFSDFVFQKNFDVDKTSEVKKLEDWLEGVDTVIAAIGD